MGADPSRYVPNAERAEKWAEQLLTRWGVLLRDLLAREAGAPAWRDLLPVLRRMEARGQIRGGRFVAGFTGEQFARPEALDLLRAVRRAGDATDITEVPSADPSQSHWNYFAGSARESTYDTDPGTHAASRSPAIPMGASRV